jgi:hypothetical protein
MGAFLITGSFSLRSKIALNKILRGEGIFKIKIEDFYFKNTLAPIGFLDARLSSEARNSAYYALIYKKVVTSPLQNVGNCISS